MDTTQDDTQMAAASSSVSTPDASKLSALLSERPLAALALFCDPSQRARLRKRLKRRLNRAQHNRAKVTRYRQELARGFLGTTEKDLHGHAPIHAAAMCGRKAPLALDIILSALATLPERQRDIDVRDHKGLSALAHAVLADWGDGVSKLISAGANVNAPFCDKENEEWKRIPGHHASLLSFAVFLNSMSAYRALIEGGAKHNAWDRSGMRPIHVAVLCGNLDAVRDLIAMDGNLATGDRQKAIELYTVREKFIPSASPPFGLNHGLDDDDDNDDRGSEPLGEDMMHMEDDDLDNDSNDSNAIPWGFENSANPNSSRDFYRSLTADLDDYDIDQNGGNMSDAGSDPDMMSDSFNIVALGENDRDDIDIGASDDDDDDSLPDLVDLNNDGDEEMPDAADEKQNSDDAKIATELVVLLQGTLKYALARAERRRKASEQSASVDKDKAPETNGISREGAESSPANGLQSNGEIANNPTSSMQDGSVRVLRGANGSETHIVQMGDVVRVQHLPGTMDDGDDESEGNQLHLQLLQLVYKALNEYQKEFYGANLLHLAARQKQHDIIRFLLESAPYAQHVADRQNDGLTALHVAAEVDDPVAIEMLLAAGSDINVRCDTHSTTPLMVAAKRGLVDAVKILLEKEARVVEEDDEGKTALHYVAESESDCEELVQFLVDRGAGLNAQATDGSTPVYTAVANENIKVFRKLLELGGDPSIATFDGSVPLGFIATKSMKDLAAFGEFVAKNQQIKEKIDMNITIGDHGQTALHIAANEGHTGAVKALVDAGANVNKLNDFGTSALMMVCRAEDITSEERLNCIKHLVSAGADVKVAGDEGKQAIHYVTFMGESECVELLLKHGADPSAVTSAKTPLHLCALENLPGIAEILLKYGAKLNALDALSMTPLMYASLKHSTECLSVLIKAGADLTQKAEGGMTALHISSVTADPRAEETVRLLCEAGAPMDVKDSQGMCPIHLHCDFERTSCVRRLLMCGCDPNLRCESGFTPLIRTCNAKTTIDDKLTLVRVLLRAGADVNAKNDNDNTVMSYLGDTEELQLIRVMLAAGADINVRDKQGDTPLHEAAMGNHPRTVSLLIRRGAEVNARNYEEEQTPLFIAAKNGYTDVVKALLARSANADISIPDKDGVTPYHAARNAGNPEHDNIASMLLDARGVNLSQFAPLTKFDTQSPAVSFDATDADALRRRDSGRLVCCICQEQLKVGEDVRVLPCGHVYHDACILEWLGGERMTIKRTCPICKQMVAPINLFSADS